MSWNFSNFVRLSIPEGIVKKITRKSDGVVLWAKGYVNQVPISKDANGNIYNGVGYKNGYRVRSGGAEATSTNTSCTGFIPVKAGDVVRVSGWDWFAGTSSQQALNVADSNFTNLGQFTMGQNARYGIFESTYKNYTASSIVEEKDGLWKWVVPPAESGIAYIRITGYDGTNGISGSQMIVTINEEIE